MVRSLSRGIGILTVKLLRRGLPPPTAVRLRLTGGSSFRSHFLENDSPESQRLSALCCGRAATPHGGNSERFAMRSVPFASANGIKRRPDRQGAPDPICYADGTDPKVISRLNLRLLSFAGLGGPDSVLDFLILGRLQIPPIRRSSST